MTEAGVGSLTAEPIHEHERASATPVAMPRRASATAGAAGPVAPPLWRDTDRAPGEEAPTAAVTHESLARQQQWFAQAIMTPESEADPAGIVDVARRLTPGPALSSRERLEVYRRAYHARLIECLVDDYPALQAAVGVDTFDALARQYIERHPSTGPNLNTYGRAMAAFCRDDSPRGLLGATHAFASELARLEWALVEVIHAPSAEPLTPTGLGNIPVERWADARLSPTPAFRLLETEYPVNTYFQAFRAETAVDIPSPARSAVVVYRSGATLWRMNLTPPMVALLQGLMAGHTLATSIEGAAAALSDLSEEEAAGRVLVWFRDWVASGLFSRIDFTP